MKAAAERSRRRHRLSRCRNLSPGAFGGAILLLVSLIAGCARDLPTEIVGAAQFQVSAADAYEAARAQQLNALMACRDAAIAAGKPIPAQTPEGSLGDVCSGVGAPLPYGFGFLRTFGDSVGRLKSAIEAAQAVAEAGASSDPAVVEDAKKRMAAALAATIQGAAAAKVAVPAPKK